jgi:endoglucanase
MQVKNVRILLILLVVLFSRYLTSETLNNEFKIRTGVNVSHWLSQSDKRGVEREKYITKTDFDTIASLGFDHVRIPVDEVQLWDSLGDKQQEAFQLLNNAINWALEANLRVIVDLHIIRSHFFNAAHNPLWTSKAEQQKLVNMWKILSKELRKYPTSMVAYEILNEAVADNPDDWNKLFSKVIKEIRKEEPKRKIVIGSNRWQVPGTFTDLKLPKNDHNIILSFHFYTPMALTHHKAPWAGIVEYTGTVNYPGQIIDTSNYAGLSESTINIMRSYANGFFTKETLEKEMLPAIRIAKEKNLQLFCGEFGIYPTIPEEIMLRWYKDMCEIFNKNNIAYCHWCYKGDFPVIGDKGIPKYKLTSVLTSK